MITVQCIYLIIVSVLPNYIHAIAKVEFPNNFTTNANDIVSSVDLIIYDSAGLIHIVLLLELSLV